MNIGLITPNYPPNTRGGGELSAKLLAEHLREKVHDVEVLSFDSEPEDDYDYVERFPQESERFDVRNIQARGKIKEFAKEKDVIHSYNMTFHPAVASLRNTKTVATLNNYKFFYPYSVPEVEENPSSRIYRTMHDATCRILMRRIDSFTALSTAVKEQYSRILPEEKIEVIPNMYDPKFPEFKDIETDKSELLYIGKLVEKKGVNDLIKAMQELEGKKLRIIGDGDERKKLEQKAEELGVENRVIFEGYVDHEELPEYYERAGYFIHPGRWPEPFGRTILEAMQMKTLVIATNTGGPKDVLSQEQLVHDSSEIPEKMDKIDRDEIIEEQNDKIENYNPEEVLKKFEEVYKRL